MKSPLILAATFLAMGCGKKDGNGGAKTPAPAAPNPAKPDATPTPVGGQGEDSTAATHPPAHCGFGDAAGFCWTWNEIPSQTHEGWVANCPEGKVLLGDVCENLLVKFAPSERGGELSFRGAASGTLIRAEAEFGPFFAPMPLNRGTEYAWRTAEAFPFQNVFLRSSKLDIWGNLVENTGTSAPGVVVDYLGSQYDFSTYTFRSFEAWCVHLNDVLVGENLYWSLPKEFRVLESFPHGESEGQDLTLACVNQGPVKGYERISMMNVIAYCENGNRDNCIFRQAEAR